METITINIDKYTKEMFKETVSKEYGLRKGQLGKAVNEALALWIEQKRQKKIAEELMKLSSKGLYRLPKRWKFNRDEVYDRN